MRVCLGTVVPIVNHSYLSVSVCVVCIALHGVRRAKQEVYPVWAVAAHSVLQSGVKRCSARWQFSLCVCFDFCFQIWGWTDTVRWYSIVLRLINFATMRQATWQTGNRLACPTVCHTLSLHSIPVSGRRDKLLTMKQLSGLSICPSVWSG